MLKVEAKEKSDLGSNLPAMVSMTRKVGLARMFMLVKGYSDRPTNDFWTLHFSIRQP